NYMNDLDSVEAVAVCDRDGLIIASESREESESESILGVISAVLDSYIDRIKQEFGTESNFLNITSTGDKKFAYCSQGPHSILTTIAEPSITDMELRVYSEHIARKVELLISGTEEVTIEIPEIIRLLSKSKEGVLPKGEYSTKLILTGDFQVGKTSLIKRFIENSFQENYIATIGVEISKKTIDLSSDTTIQFIIWDIGGQKQEMMPFRKRFYSGANAAIIVIDRTRPNHQDSIHFWFNELKDANVSPNIPIVIVGNKSDLVDDIIVSEFDIKKIADEYGYRYILTSAKTGENVNDAFTYIAYRFIETV
ncbi:MAG: GTP-binding protein, partial [Promethearchaeota archaeon]